MYLSEFGSSSPEIEQTVARAAAFEEIHGRRPRILVAKMGQDGHTLTLTPTVPLPLTPAAPHEREAARRLQLELEVVQRGARQRARREGRPAASSGCGVDLADLAHGRAGR